MFSQLKRLVKEYGDKIMNDNPDVPLHHRKAVVDEARKTIKSGIKKLKENGKMDQLAQMFKSGSPDTNKGVFRRLSDGLVDGLSDKLNINKPVARTIAATLILGVIGGLFATGVLMSTRASAQAKQAKATPVDFHRGKKGQGRRYLAQRGALEGGLRKIHHKHIRRSHRDKNVGREENESKRA